MKFFCLATLLCSFLLSCKQEINISDAGNLVPKTVTQDVTIPAISVNGAKLHSQAFGPVDSTLIIAIHGGPGADFRYMLNCKSLADRGYRVVFYDQRGSGLSQRFSKDWYTNWQENAVDKVFYDELKGVINHYKTSVSQKVVLLGHSWGAMLATGYAAKYPNEINGLVVAEPGGLQWDDVIEYIGNSRAFGLWDEALNDVTFIDQFITGKENQHEILDYKFGLMGAENTIVGDIHSNLGPNSIYYKATRNGAVINMAMFENGEKYKPNLSTGISQFQKKVLFLYSSNNKAYPESWAAKISAVYPNKEVFKVNGVGHSGMIDQIGTWTNTTEPKVLAYLQNL